MGELIRIRLIEGKQPEPIGDWTPDPGQTEWTVSPEIAAAAEAKGVYERVLKIKRKEGMPPALCISYPVGDRSEQWRPDPEKSEFEVSAIIAQFAIETGFFEQAPDSQAKLKRTTKLHEETRSPELQRPVPPFDAHDTGSKV